MFPHVVKFFIIILDANRACKQNTTQAYSDTNYHLNLLATFHMLYYNWTPRTILQKSFQMRHDFKKIYIFEKKAESV